MSELGTAVFASGVYNPKSLRTAGIQDLGVKERVERRAATAWGSDAWNQQHMLLVMRITNPGKLNVPVKARLSRVRILRILQCSDTGPPGGPGPDQLTGSSSKLKTPSRSADERAWRSA